MSQKKVIINIGVECCPLSSRAPPPWKTPTSTPGPLCLFHFLPHLSLLSTSFRFYSVLSILLLFSSSFFFFHYLFSLTNLLRPFLDNYNMNNTNKYNNLQNKITPYIVLLIQITILILIN